MNEAVTRRTIAAIVPQRGTPFCHGAVRGDGRGLCGEHLRFLPEHTRFDTGVTGPPGAPGRERNASKVPSQTCQWSSTIYDHDTVYERYVS